MDAHFRIEVADLRRRNYQKKSLRVHARYFWESRLWLQGNHSLMESYYLDMYPPKIAQTSKKLRTTATFIVHSLGIQLSREGRELYPSAWYR